MDLIDRYLDELATRLRVGPTEARRLLAEAEEHLRDAAAAEEADGSEPRLAQERAIARFGSAREVAAASGSGLAARAGALVVGLAHLGVVGSAAILAGSVLARVAAAATSTTVVFGLPRDDVPRHAQVAHWLAAQPTARDWRSAAAMENADDTLVLRGGFALLCLLVSLAVVLVARRRAHRLPDAVVPAVGATAFGGAAVVLLAGALANARTGLEWGHGLLLTDASIALVAALGYAAVLLRRLRLT